jgi:hypothetical protein
MLDLIKEDQIVGDDDAISRIRKAASKEIFWFIKSFVKEHLETAKNE